MSQRENRRNESAAPGQEPGGGRRRIPVWDPPTRLFHWTLAALVTVGWITGEAGKLDLHMRIGEAILALVVFRIAWGLVGSRHSRFADFLVGPRAAVAHLRELRARLRGSGTAASPSPHLGHTALGGWMIAAMLLVLAIQTGTGLFSSDEILTDGPLNHLVDSGTAHRLDSIHHIGVWLIPILVLIHVAAALFYALVLRENLIWPLITGRKDASAPSTAPQPRFASAWLALALAIAAVAIVWGIISL